MVRRGLGGLLVLPVLALLLLGVLVVLPPGANALNINPSVTIQQTSTASMNLNQKDIFWHNSSSLNQSNPVKIPVNLTGYTSIQSFSFLLTASAGQWIPQIVVSQGATIIFNATVSNQVFITPIPGNTPVSVNTVKLFNISGATPPNGIYSVWDNVSQTIFLTDATPAGWSLSGIIFSLSDTVTASYGYYLNSTQVLFPFPSGVSVNYSSAKASPGRFAISYGGIYGYNTTLKSTGTVTITSSFQPVPINSGPAVFVTLTKARLIGGTLNTYTSFGNWTDNLGLPYIGIYVLLVSFNGYILNPTSIGVSESSSVTGKWFTANPASYSVDPSDVVILPNNLLVGLGATESWQVNFSSLQSPPTGSLTPTTVLITLNGFPVTLALILEFSMAAVAVYAALVYELYHRRGKGSIGQRRASVRAIMADLVFIEVSLVAFWVLSTLF